MKGLDLCGHFADVHCGISFVDVSYDILRAAA